MKAFIKTHKRLGEEAIVVLAQVTGCNGDLSRVDRKEFMSSLSAASENKFRVVPNSVTHMFSDRLSSFVRAVMIPTVNIIPAPDNMSTFTALSANMYVDSNDTMWALRQNADGNVLVMASEQENIDQLMDMMASCSSTITTLRTVDPVTAKAFEQHESMLTGIECDDVVSAYCSESNSVRIGSVVAVDKRGTEAKIIVAPFDGGDKFESTSSAICVFVDGKEIQYPALQQTSLSSGAVDIERLVDYFRRMFSYSPEYFQTLESKIRNHAFC